MTMQKYAALVRQEGQDSWEWAGFANGTDVVDASVALAQSTEGYSLDINSQEEILEKFQDDGWRFRLIKVYQFGEGKPTEFYTQEVLGYARQE